MNLEIDRNTPLFKYLRDKKPRWWENLKSDPDLYIDIRKNNKINVYCHGASLIKLEFKQKLLGTINQMYIPIFAENDYIPYTISESNISINPNFAKPIDLCNFSPDVLVKIKERMKQKFTSRSEKGIQAGYVLRNKYFIDTEMQLGDSRIDLVWLGKKELKIYFVELKTITDDRIYVDHKVKKPNIQSIYQQLLKYRDHLIDHKDKLIKYYNELVKIKADLKILPCNYDGPVDLKGFEIETRPILLIGDCTDGWINEYAFKINEKIKDLAFPVLCHGINTKSFHIPKENREK